MENILNNFLSTLEEELKNIEENNKEDYILYRVNSILKNTNNNIFLKNNFTNLLAKNNIDTICKVQYNNKPRKIILITQYYKTDNEKRSKENYVCLLNNILNDNIDKIILLNEEEYDLDFLFENIDNKYRTKLKQINIESRLRYYDAFNYVNTYYKNSIIIVANLDIFFDNNLDKLKNYNLTNKFFSISRYDLKNDYNFNGNNQIQKITHDGPLGDPCIDSADTWIFESPIKHGDNTKIMLGANGCDTAINYIMKYDYKYDVYNPINSIITIHYHLMSNKERENYNKNSIMTYGNKIYNTKKEFKPSEVNHLYLNHKTIKLCNKIETFCTFATKSDYKDLRLLLHSLELYHKDIPIFIICDKWVNDKIDNDKYALQIHKIYKEYDISNIIYILNEALQKYKNTLFINNSIILLNNLDLLIDKKFNIGISNNYINKNIYDLIYVNDINNINKIEEYINTGNFYKFGLEYNYKWFNNKLRLIEEELLVDFKKIRCINTTLYENVYENMNKYNFNKKLLEVLDKIKHPIIQYIFDFDNYLFTEKNIKINKNIAFCLTIKNTDIYLPYIINNIEKLAIYIKNVSIIFIYDNIDDKSIEILNKYKIKSSNNIILQKIINNEKLRTYRLENARNEYLKIIYNKLNNIDYHIVIDSDDVNIDTWNIELILKQFKNNKWDILSFNRKKYYDIWALLYKNFEFPCWGYGENCEEIIKFIEKDISNKLETLNNTDLMECYSSFNGFCIYNTQKLKDIKYSGKWDNVKDMIYNLDIGNTLNFLRKNLKNNSIKTYEEGQINNNDTINKNEICEHIYYNLTAKMKKNLNIYICKYKLDDDTIDINNKPIIIIPKQININNFWYHTGDTFRELVDMWKQQNLCNIIQGDTKHVWFNKIGDVLLYDRPTLEWLDKDNNIEYNKILFGNPEIPDKLKDKAYNWIFWGRRPAILEEMSKNILSYNERVIKSIFIGKIENAVQNKYRTIEDWGKYIEVYKMHLPNEKYIYTQDEYLHLLKKSKFGLSIRGYGPKCNREIELMALGTVPIIDNNVNMDYHNKPIENVHYFRINKPEEIVKIIDNCSEKQWTEMSRACIKWYNDNCSCIGSFNITMDIINNLKENNKEIAKKKFVNTKSKINNKLFGVQNLLLNIN